MESKEDHLQLIIPYGRIVDGAKEKLIVTLEEHGKGIIEDNRTHEKIHISSHSLSNIKDIIEVVAKFLHLTD